MKRSLRTSKGAGILVGIIFALLLTGVEIWLGSIILGFTTLDRVSTLFYVKGLSLPILLDGIVGSMLIKIKWKAVGWTVIVAGIAMSPLIPGYLVRVT